MLPTRKLLEINGWSFIWIIKHLDNVVPWWTSNHEVLFSYAMSEYSSSKFKWNNENK